MAIRESFRRAFGRSSASSGSDSSQNEITTTTSKTSSTEGSSLHKTSSRLTWTWSNNQQKTAQHKAQRKNSKGGKRKVVHPSERPLTEQNLRHQEMLSHFTMTFGTSRPEQIEMEGFEGISPCCTRANSIDYSNASGSSTPQIGSD